ncbi:MAG: efflux RND transporter periplasmic adaptor subunit [Saprospiraceae bacterium]
MKYLISIIIGIILLSCQSKKQEAEHDHAEEIYTCPMHPEIIRNEPGSCPICGMDLVLQSNDGAAMEDALGLNTLLQPTNAAVLTRTPVTTLEQAEYSTELEVFGNIAYDTRTVGSIAARIGGRIEKLYVQYRYQPIQKGQKIMDIYSPELLTEQQNLLYLLNNDVNNTALIQAAKDRLALLGMTNRQINALVQNKKPIYAVTVYSNYTGHIHEAGSAEMTVSQPIMQSVALSTQPLALREGMYMEKGQSIFSVYNPNRAWILLNLFPADLAKVKVGNKARIQPESAPDVDFRVSIDYIEPIVREGATTTTARIYFDNSKLKLPIGDRVRALVFGNPVNGAWLPTTAVLSLGQQQVAFQKQGDTFRAIPIKTGLRINDKVEIISGLSPMDSVATNAQYLIDSESFIKVNKEKLQ